MERVFYGVLERVGSNGRYQVINQLIHCLYVLICGASTFFNAYLFYQKPYQCPLISDSNACNRYVCGLDQSQRASFIDSSFHSFSGKFGDHRCNDFDLDKIQIFIYIGGIVGAIVGTYLSELMTNRKLLILCVCINIFGMIIALVGPTLFVASIGLFLNFAAKCIQMQIVMCYITESVHESIRPKYIILCYISFGMAATFNGPVFKYLTWELALILYAIVPLVISLCGLLFYVNQTPFDMITNYPPQQSLEMLRDIANKNDVQFTITLQEIVNIRHQYDENEKQKQHQSISVCDLFKYESLRGMIIVSIFLHFLTSFQFNAPQLALKNYELDIYLNGPIIGFSEVIASIYSYCTISDQPRKKGLAITQIISFVISTLTVFAASCTFSSCTLQQKILQSIGLFLFRLFSTVAYNFFYMIQYETFPNQVRGMALQVTAIASYSAVLVTPSLMTFCNNSGIPIIAFYALSCIFATLLTLKLDQTKDIPPPQIIKELQYQTQGIDQKFHLH